MPPVLPQASKGATPDPIVLTGDIGPPVSLRDLPTAENRFDLQLTALKTDSPPTQAPVPPQALRSSPGLPDQILTALRKLENNEIELQLDPPELGGLRITLKTEGELAQVRFAADRPETMDLLRRSRGDLQEGLNEQGFSHVSFSFEGRDHEDPGPGQAGQPPPSALRPDDNPLHAAATAVRQGSDGLDLRL
ncbi:flagellar hook-length control protein FliK [Falsigemmobacter intermedius]|uniref:flagellar hook-length control protein FliK n=1 Tax=Falsigemmobacter intermedius TaxID=1553448 RepID=UPI003F0F289D